MTSLSPTVEASEGVDQAAIVDSIEQIRQWIKAAPWGHLLDFDGVDAIDVLLSPIFLNLLNALRGGSRRPESASQALLDRMRTKAFRVKMAYRERVAARNSSLPAATDVLLWPRTITHVTSLRPLAEALGQQSVPYRLLACEPRIFHRLQQQDPSAVFTSGGWPQRIRQARKDGRRRAKELSGVGPWKLPPLLGKDVDLDLVVRRAVIEHLPLASEATSNARAALEAFRPKILVVGNDITPEGRAACRVAAARGVPSAVFMHGSITGEGWHGLHCADRVLVYGEHHRRQLVQQGVAEERIVVCGAPNLDHRPLPTGQTHPLLLARLGLQPGEPWILVATSGPGHSVSHRHHQLVVENLFRLGASMPDLNIVIKLHRKDRLDYYRQRLKASGGSKLVVVPDGAGGFPSDIFDWLQGCSMVLTGASAVGVQAMLMDVPVISMDFCDEIHDIDFIEAGATTHVRSAESLEQAVREIQSLGSNRSEVQSRVREHLEGAFFALDGGSASRGCQALRGLMAAKASA